MRQWGNRAMRWVPAAVGLRQAQHAPSPSKGARIASLRAPERREPGWGPATINKWRDEKESFALCNPSCAGPDSCAGRRARSGRVAEAAGRVVADLLGRLLGQALQFAHAGQSRQRQTPDACVDVP